ncbi:2TM domain-containing protein [Flavobacterium rhizosphaerae]|uniref:2TM domain-containing protein n=1 Tax=Flavobacterium rhizosphaerae TaxID=3163298 RepID=A0ABW8YXT7_9FLAO
MENSSDQYRKMERARKRVKAIKGFYKHFTIYIIVNMLLLIVHWLTMEPGEQFLTWNTFTTAFFWGIGLLCHGFAVFGTDFLFGAEWEERKIKKYMGEDNTKHKKWE